MDFLIFLLLMSLSSCAVHDYFPFICFERGCVKQQFGGINKQIRAKISLVKRNRDRKKAAKDRKNPKARHPVSEPAEEKEESTAVEKGRNVDYYRYLLLFKLKEHPERFDSITVEHTSDYKTITEVDQSRLNQMLDTIRTRDIIIIYIKENFSRKEVEQEYAHVARARVNSIRKYLRRSGIPSARIRFVQDSLSPPRL